MFLAGVFLIIFFIYHCSFPVVQNNARDYTFGALFGTTWMNFGASWTSLGAIWVPAGRQGAPKIELHQVAPNKSKKKTIAKKCQRLLCARCFLAPLDRFWAPFGRFGAPFGPQLGAKGLPKSTVWAPSRTKNSKNESQNEASKNV